eukprot:6214837-Pleurochrysis_carterae.AAC.6
MWRWSCSRVSRGAGSRGRVRVRVTCPCLWASRALTPSGMRGRSCPAQLVRLDIEQRAHAFAEGAHAVGKLIGNKTVSQAISGGEGAIQTVKLLMVFVKCTKRSFSNAFDFEGTHHGGFNERGDIVGGGDGFKNEDIKDKVASARAAACAMIRNASRGIIEGAENAFNQLAIDS